MCGYVMQSTADVARHAVHRRHDGSAGELTGQRLGRQRHRTKRYESSAGRQCDWFLLSMAAYLTKLPYGVGILLLNTESCSSPMCILTVTIRLKTPSWTFRP